ncbi:P-II family nitrogen regulator [Herbivorax sp. ANBcel31]|uniref:P-II family nitrogen regulator n=1 Tax=Herbivorax sp. ANBcel31 TaxID=3069754 RepID=UPI0027AE91E6|nr:P-II family nitrogen regulator [Herbivorax sp. ANBcel31]MDQ2087108.1 P-II family nitrogen regulator [Herbivorax sp. ANBcel31]
MKEILAVIRMNMINKTKEELVKQGFSSLTCKRVLGRGKKKVDYSIIENLIFESEIPSPKIAETISEIHRLIPKRMLSVVAKDEDVQKVVDTIISINSSGKPGDGKIFVVPITEVIRIRTKESGEIAI